MNFLAQLAGFQNLLCKSLFQRYTLILSRSVRIRFYYKTPLGLTQQAPVRRGPRASATSLFTVSLAESEASAFLPNRVCVSPILINLTYYRIACN